MASKLVLKAEDYQKIEASLNLKDEEDYSVVTHKVKASWYRSIHVFFRRPTTKELTTYEEKAGKLKFRGTRAEMEGSRLQAGIDLYNSLIDRVYDYPYGRRILGDISKGEKPLDRQSAKEYVDPLTKRAAILDFVSEVYSASQIEEREGVEGDPSKEDEREEVPPSPKPVSSVSTSSASPAGGKEQATSVGSGQGGGA